MDWQHHIRGLLREYSRSEPAAGGVLRAKAVIADRRRALVTSADLAERSIESNIELGLLVDDPAIASRIGARLLARLDISSPEQRPKLVAWSSHAAHAFSSKGLL